jgi:hemerythrin-like domain-containing protein
MQNNILKHDHDELGELLNDLQTSLKQRELDRAFQLLDLFWARLAIHIRAENLVLFPAILQAVSLSKGLPSIEEAADAIAELRSDHNFFMTELADCVNDFRDVLAGNKNADQLDEIGARVDAVTVRLDSHNILEEQKVYQWPAVLLNVTDLEAMEAKIKKQLANIPPRFKNSI